MGRQNRSRRRKRSRSKAILSLLLVGVVLGIITTYVYGNPLHEKQDWKGMVRPIFVQGSLTNDEADGTGEHMLVPLDFLQKSVDPAIRYEKASSSIVMTTRQKLLHLTLSSTEGELNGKPYTLTQAPKLIGGIPYIPVQAMEEVYGADIHEDTSTGAVLVMNAGEKVELGTVNTSSRIRHEIPLRAKPSRLSFILTDMAPGVSVRLWKSTGSWYLAQLDNGYVGYVQKENVTPAGNLAIEPIEDIPSVSEKHWEHTPINLAWEAVYQRKPDPSTFGDMPGVNVMSPTWFSIVDDQGKVESKADPAYVNWAHRQQREVWGLLSNSFEPELTTNALSTFERRWHIIEQTIALAKTNKLDGINIDFENVHTKDGPNVTQFMRELKPIARANDLILSIDVTPKSQSEMWSVFLDRKALGSITDYMMVMAYDEHWAASPKSGSVASLPWVASSLKRIIEEDELPPNKVVLGIPLYTRVWSETKNGNNTKVSSKSVGMQSSAAIVEEHKLKKKYLEREGQNYVEYQDGAVLKRIWLEDKVSLQARVDLGKSLKLGGIGVWNRSFANSDVWDVLQNFNN